MPPNRRPSKNTFNIDVLSPQALDGPMGVDNAVRAIEAVCRRGGPEVAQMLIVLIAGRSYLLEHIVSVMEGGAYEKLRMCIVAGFPTATTSNVMDATGMHLLQRFSSSLTSAKYPSTVGVLPNLPAYQRKVELSFDILKVLEENYLTREKKFRVGRGKGKAVRGVDPLPFDLMGVTVPTTAVEVRDVYDRVLSQLQSVLENYLLILRNPSHSDVFKSLYAKVAQPSGEDQEQNPFVPLIQPRKNSICFDAVEGFGDWPILLSTRAMRDLRGIGKDGTMFEATIKKIEQLSLGQFSRGNQKPLTSPMMKLPIYAAQVTGDKLIVYQVDCVPDLRNSEKDGFLCECQAIRIFGVFTLAQLHRNKFWNALSRQLEQRGLDYVERCTFRNELSSTGDEVILPAVFPPLPQQVREAQDTPLSIDVSEEDGERVSDIFRELKRATELLKQIHSMLVLDKFVALSQALLASILTNKDVAHVFSLSMLEQEIIEHPLSCYVIGRSGTGKTTTMLFKMLGIQQAWQQHPDVGPKPRQVFVTQSQVFVEEVEKYFSALMSSLEASRNFFEKPHITEENVEQETEAFEQNFQLLRPQGLRSDLPDTFSGLSDRHFPLFITYHQLCKMLENDTGLIHGDKLTTSTTPAPSKSRSLAGSVIATSSDPMQQHYRSFVSYGVFLSSYWDHLPQALTQELDPALVFREFMGVIKGSEGAVGMRKRCLDWESYKSLSTRSHGTLSHKRDKVYSLFVAYTKLKEKKQEYDAADRTHYILKKLEDGFLADQKVDFLYVDEVQDHLLIDTLVLRRICANQHGLFWAGDTAQTISIGSSFRFDDLKAYHYRIERQLALGFGPTPTEPKIFQLVSNYRSHSGIVNCAHSVIELILHYWRNSIDALKPERATVEGPQPIFFCRQSDEDFETLFFKNNKGEDDGIGANQCVLVRNNAIKTTLKERHRGSIIKTIYESKGLEFDDVILYNFFKDSMATSNQWRLVLNNVFGGGSLQGTPTFDETQHAIMCGELKFLYVAITRARKKLWIADSSESAEPMKTYWNSKGLIKIWSAEVEIPSLCVLSTPREWMERGKMMFDNELYADASVAFLRAGRHREVGICEAYHLQQEAQLISTSAGKVRAQAFVAAAKALSACAQDAPSDQDDECHILFTAAGECYSKAGDSKRAGDTHLKAEGYDEAARAYREGKHIEEVVEVITQHKNALNSSLYEELMMDARMHYFKHLNMEAGRKLFDSDEDALKFLEIHNLAEARSQMLVRLGKHCEAAKVYGKNGDMLKAVETLRASPSHNADDTRWMIKYLLMGLRPGFTFGVSPSSGGSSVLKLLEFADQLDGINITKQDADEIAMFQAIRSADRMSLYSLAETFTETGNHPAALLCLDHAFSPPLSLQNLPLTRIQALLSMYSCYIQLLKQLLDDKSFAEGSNHQRLFGFQALRQSRYLAPKHTLLYKSLVGQSSSSQQVGDESICGYDVLRRGIVKLIESRIRDRTMIENTACCNVHGFSPCFQLLVQKECNSPDKRAPCTFQHIQPEQLTVDWYRDRLRLILLQFRILDSARLYKLDLANYWLGMLYSTLRPPFQGLGSLTRAAVASIPWSSSDLWIVQRWIRSVCEGLNDSSLGQVEHSRQSFMVACALAFDLGQEDTREFLPRAPMYNSQCWPQSPSRGDGYFIIQDFIEFLAAEGSDSLALGSSYLHGILRSGLPIDLNVLCDVIERLTGLFIMAHSMADEVGSRGLHEVALPRSWFISLILPDTDPKKDASDLRNFVSTIIKFMQEIDAQTLRYPTATTTPKERFVVGGSRATNLTGPLHIARICLCLCLVGYNTTSDDFRMGILSSIQSLRKGNGRLTPLAYQRYANANCWDDLVHAFTDSLISLPPDEMILLLHGTTPRQLVRWSGPIREVTYRELDRVPELLLRKIPSATRANVTRAHHQQPRVHANTGAGPSSDRNGQVQQAIPDLTRKIIHGEDAAADVPDRDRERENYETQVNATKVIQAAYRAHRRRLERRKADAARKIQAAYHLHLRRKEIDRDRIGEARTRFWHLLRTRSKEMEWPRDSQYYLLFRVPLGYILVCLDAIEALFGSEIKVLRKLIGDDADHEDLEELAEALYRYSKLRKRTIGLKMKLSPSSEFHERQSVTDLQHALLEVEEIMESLDSILGSTEMKDSIKECWNRGRKWIFEKGKSRVRREKVAGPKPALDSENLLYD